jgi:hypothetical protein
VRKAKNEQLVQSRKVAADFVKNSNAMVKGQLNAYAQFVASLQKSVTDQFANLNRIAGSTANPKFLEAEQLEQIQGPPPANVAGPFKDPKNMSAALSGMVQPGGLVNFSEDGINDVMTAMKDKMTKKKDALKEELKNFKDTTKALTDLATSCTKEGTVQALNCDGYQKNIELYCMTQPTSGGAVGAVATAAQILDKDSKTYTDNNCAERQKIADKCLAASTATGKNRKAAMEDFNTATSGIGK